MTRDETIDNIKEFLGGEADVVISDASPNLSGALGLRPRQVH